MIGNPCRPGDLAIVINHLNRYYGCLVEVHPFCWTAPDGTGKAWRRQDWLVCAIGFDFPMIGSPKRTKWACADDEDLRPLRGDPDAANVPRAPEVPA